MSTELILTGNGPGELSGWVLPVARAARMLASTSRRELRLTLALSPSQFASGRESTVVRQWGLFDRVIDPSRCVRLAFGLGKLPVAPRAALIHLGGDLWFSARLARRVNVPVCAMTETTLIVRRHRPFARVLAVSQTLAERLAAQGVPPHKLVVTGDPRVDTLTEARSELAPVLPHGESSAGGTYLVSFLPGSRDHFFKYLIPYFLSIAEVLAPSHPGTTYQVIVSPFLSPSLVTQICKEVAQRWPQLHIGWVTDASWAALARSDLVLTIPGTNTLELALAGIPFAVVMPTDRIEDIPIEGVLEWVGRLPGVGRVMKEALLTRYLSRQRFVALPNLKAGRPLVPEWVGRWTPIDLANRLADLLQDRERRINMVTALRQLYDHASGASTAVAAQGLTLADGRQEVPA